MGTGSSSKNNEQENDVRNRIDSGDFQKVSPPSSPTFGANMKVDEMSYSGILVEKPDDSSVEKHPSKGNSAVPSSEGATFAADLTTPPISNRSKSRIKNSSHVKDQQPQPRRIVKATPPSKAAVVSAEDTEASVASENVVHNNAAPLSSPIGNNANAANELLEESIEKHDSKTKQRERVTNRQKNDRERLFQEKRKQKIGASDKPKVEANPFSRFLSAFSVDGNSKHKRKEQSSNDADYKRLKYGFQDTSGSETGTASATADNSSEPSSNTKETDAVPTAENSGTNEETSEPFPIPSWVAAASVATVAILVFAIVRGKKK